jgi:hypothetical protein
MGKRFPVDAIKPFKLAFLGVELFFILMTLAALVDVLVPENWGLGWATFFLGFIASAWGAVAYPMCGGCFGWDRKA